MVNKKFVFDTDGFLYYNDNYVKHPSKSTTTGTSGDHPYNGMGKVVLKKNMVNNVNTLTQTMLTKQNTIYVIQYDFILGGNITVPANCVLEFDGGSISGAYTINGNNTGINAGLVKIFNTDVTLSGSWNVAEAYPEWFGAKGDGVTDCAEAIQKTLDVFFACYFHAGSYAVGNTITVNGNIYGQYANSLIIPTFDGDLFRITDADRCVVGITIKGGEWDNTYYQPRNTLAGAAIIVGYNGSNSQNCRIQDCNIHHFYGTGILWEHGSKLMIDNVTIAVLTGDGIACTPNYDDNNEGTFINTHIMLCSGIGYNIQDGASMRDDKASRCHCFVNTKAFDNNQNYYIGTIGNFGSVMSELGVIADTFSVKSAGNKFFFYSTENKYKDVVDNGTKNVISGYDNWNGVWDNNRYIRNLYINAQKEGYQIFRQTNNNVFEDSIDGTSADVTINHNKGTASTRKDTFETIKSKSTEVEVDINDGSYFDYFNPSSSSPDIGPKILKAYNKNHDFSDPFVIAPRSDNDGKYWCLGTKASGYLAMFVEGIERLRLNPNGFFSKDIASGKFCQVHTSIRGTTAERPTSTNADVIVGTTYFDTTLGKPIWCKGLDSSYQPIWVDATGATV